MSKTILIFSDGTGQIGGLRPDQCLSNVYKIYRATRSGPDSPVPPSKQVAFYDPGLGAGEVGGLTFKRLRNALAAGVGTGIDENVIDCYAAIIARYEPGDRICLFGFSRGAYTARALANVLNLCGVPTRCAQGKLVPRHGPQLRVIASEAVRSIYNHGAGKDRKRYEHEREILAARFRSKYGSEGSGADGEGQGNVQPYFVGIFDSVAALGSRDATLVALTGTAALVALTYYAFQSLPNWAAWAVALAPIIAAYWGLRSFASHIKIFTADELLSLSKWNPRRWLGQCKSWHVAWWSGKHYDKYVDREIRYLRHALAIDEDRAKFPRVGWGRGVDDDWNKAQGRGDWLRQIWFAGNHSDIGGSYPEEEARLSDIALQWMVDELQSALKDEIVIDHLKLNTGPDALGLQHCERQAMLDRQPSWLKAITGRRLSWRREIRDIDPEAHLHPSVYDRLKAAYVPQMGEVKPYRPENLRGHKDTSPYY